MTMPVEKTGNAGAILHHSGLVMLMLLLTACADKGQSKEISYTEFVNEVRAGRMAEVEISSTSLRGTLKVSVPGNEGEPQVVFTGRLPGIEETKLLDELESRGVKVTGLVESTSTWPGWLLVFLAPIFFFYLLLRLGSASLAQRTGDALTFGKNRAKIFDQSGQNKVTFQDVAGVDEAVEEVREVVDFLRNPEKYQRLGGRIPKGVLLLGPPGTGKTLLARAIAGEAGVAFFSISGSEFVEMFVGVGAARVRDLFNQAREKAPCIIFIDELDAIGKSRASGRGMFLSNEEREQTLNQLLTEMDGFDTSKGVIMMAATNRPEVLDPALLRAGRFDRQVVIDRPDLRGREAILKVHARNVKLGEHVDLKTIAARTPGMVGADLANIINEAALLAARHGGQSVTMNDLEEAIDRVMLGLEKKSRLMSADEKERVAFHEAGHTMVALSVKHAAPVHRVSIIPRSVGALGHTLQLPTQERFLMTKPEIEDQIAVMLGGRAAEEIVYNGVVSTGASDDLERASELARQMVVRFGMSERLGNMTYGRSLDLRFLKSEFPAEERNYSEQTAELIDAESRRIIDDAYHHVTEILTGHRYELEQIARQLIDKETLEREELDAIVQREARPFPVDGFEFPV